jgi:GPH family glycoside/pentoside/hexuronide:cation symporter
MVVVGFINFKYVPERYYDTVQTRQKRVGFVEMIHKTFSCFPFVILLGVAFTYAIPTSAMNTLGYYAGNYYVAGGDLALYGQLAMYGGFAYAICGIGGIQPARILSVKYGKRAALAIILASGMITFGLSWVLFTPTNPWLMVIHSGLNGFCATGLWVILPSMTVDTIDYEEGRSGQRREGGFNSAFSWTMKAGMVAASVMAGTALDSLTGFNAELGGNQTPETMEAIRLIFALGPMGACVLSLAFLAFYPLSTERMHRLRVELEGRRGHV